jgi:hypothetical protein
MQTLDLPYVEMYSMKCQGLVEIFRKKTWKYNLQPRASFGPLKK